ncbi:MAG: hypothetical protein AB7P40_19225 [Chloroflexota bacterium]
MDWKAIGAALTSDATLLGIGVVLSIIVAVAWVFSNRAEATPNVDQMAEMRHFVNDHFAKYVARGLAAGNQSHTTISQDKAWQRVYLQHLRLHNELYAFRSDVALSVFREDIDAAVSRELAAIQEQRLRLEAAAVAS